MNSTLKKRTVNSEYIVATRNSLLDFLKSATDFVLFCSKNPVITNKLPDDILSEFNEYIIFISNDIAHYANIIESISNKYKLSRNKRGYKAFCIDMNTYTKYVNIFDEMAIVVAPFLDELKTILTDYDLYEYAKETPEVPTTDIN